MKKSVATAPSTSVIGPGWEVEDKLGEVVGLPEVEIVGERGSRVHQTHELSH